MIMPRICSLVEARSAISFFNSLSSGSFRGGFSPQPFAEQPPAKSAHLFRPLPSLPPPPRASAVTRPATEASRGMAFGPRRAAWGFSGVQVSEGTRFLGSWFIAAPEAVPSEVLGTRHLPTPSDFKSSAHG